MFYILYEVTYVQFMKLICFFARYLYFQKLLKIFNYDFSKVPTRFTFLPEKEKNTNHCKVNTFIVPLKILNHFVLDTSYSAWYLKVIEIIKFNITRICCTYIIIKYFYFY